MRRLQNISSRLHRNLLMVQSRAGFTLLEFMAVLCLILILVLISLNHRQFAAFQSDVIVRGFASDIRYVYHKSRYAQQNSELTYLFEKSDTQLGFQIVGYVVEADGVPVREVYFPKRMKVRSSNDLRRIVFGSSGSFQGHGETILIEDQESGSHYKVTIVPFSGRVEVYKSE